MAELAQHPSEGPRAWLARLEAADVKALTLAQQRARTCYMAAARRLIEEEQQKARWARGRA
jgi:hypothetical protein